MLTKKEVIERVVEIRKELGWSMETTARYLDVSITTFQRWEYGETEPNFGNGLKLVDFINKYENGKIDEKGEKEEVPMELDLGMEKTEESDKLEVYET